MKTPHLSIHPCWKWILISLFAAAGFAAGLFLPLRLSLPLRNDLVLPLLFIFLAVWAALRLPAPWDDAVSTSVVLMVFSACLAALWRTGSHGVYDTFGLLPWFDSTGYYSESLRLLDGGTFTQIAARRPIFPALFSTLLLITGRNLRIAILLLTLTGGLSTWILVREIKSSEKNSVLPTAVAVLLFMFYRKFNGSVLTDTLGFSLGVLGMAFLWNAVNRRDLKPALAGLFCLTLGQSARPGAVFTLPLLFLWIVLLLPSGERWLKKGVLAGLVVIGGLLVNTAVTAALAPGVSASYANFSYQVYSLVNGGTGWQTVYYDHPELFAGGNEGEAARQIYRLSWDIFSKDPQKAANAGIRAVSAFFSAAPNSAFNYLDSSTTPRDVTPQNAPLEFILRWIANILLILLLPAALFFHRDRKLSLLLALNIGVILSLPIAAPWDIENMRAYSVSIASLVLGIGYVALLLIGKTRRIQPAETPAGGCSVTYPAYGLTGLLLIGIVVVPLMVRFTTHALETPKGTCHSGQEQFITRISAGSTVHVGKTASNPYAIPYERYLKDLDQFPDALLGQGLKTVPEGSVISQQNDMLHGGNAFWLIGPEVVMRPTNRQAIYCGQFKQITESAQIFFAESVIEP